MAAHVRWSALKNSPAKAARMAQLQRANLQRALDFHQLSRDAGIVVDTLQAIFSPPPPGEPEP